MPGWLIRHARARARLLLSAALAIAVAALLPGALRPATRLLLGWDAGVVVFLAACWSMMGEATPERLRQRAQQQDEGKWAILTLTTAAALSSVFAIGFELSGTKELSANRAALRIILAAATIVLSWTFTHTMFALHYAHAYYGDDPDDGSGGTVAGPALRGGLEFPGNETPDYWDFMYFSFVIGMTCQVSDVQVYTQALRRLALAHGVLAFFFNTVILALTINIAAGVL